MNCAPRFDIARNDAHELLRVDMGVLGKANLELGTATVNLRNANALALKAQGGRLKQVDSCVGQRAIAIFHFGAKVGDGFFVSGAGDFLVEPQALVLFGHVALVDAQRNAEIELRTGTVCTALALDLFHGGLKHGGVELESDGFNVAALLAAEHVAGTAQFEIERGNFESRAQIAELLKRCETAARDLTQLLLGRNEQISISAAIGAADTAA